MTEPQLCYTDDGGTHCTCDGSCETSSAEPRLTVDNINSDALDELYFRLARAEEGERRAKARARHWYHRASRYSEAWMSARRGRRTLSAELTRRAPLLGESQAAIARVRALHTDWLSTAHRPSARASPAGGTGS